jgi:hypothetical protein
MRVLLLVLSLLLAMPAFAEESKSVLRKSLDPMNRPMNELGVTGKDDTLCSDRWYSCTTYDRQQFDQKYPGRPLNELLRFGEPNWPDKNRTHRKDPSDRHDPLDKYPFPETSGR